MQLSKNFSLQELTKSQQGTRLGINNTPSDTVINNLQGLVNSILQPLRDMLKKPISISSGYRSFELNTAIGGSRTSEHCFGYAADIEVPGIDNKQLFDIIKKNFKFTQLILEFYQEGIPDSGWVHVSMNPTNLKNQSLLAVKQNNKTVYLPG